MCVPTSDGQTLTYVDMVESPNPVRFAVSLGDRRPLYCTAGGRALLAALPETEVDVYLSALEPTRLTGRTETSKPELAGAVADARVTGVAQTVDQAADGVTGTAALIRDAAGEVLGALVLAAPTPRWEGRRGDLADFVRAEAVTTSRSFGYRPTR